MIRRETLESAKDRPKDGKGEKETVCPPPPPLGLPRAECEARIGTEDEDKVPSPKGGVGVGKSSSPVECLDVAVSGVYEGSDGGRDGSKASGRVSELMVLKGGTTWKVGSGLDSGSVTFGSLVLNGTWAMRE